MPATTQNINRELLFTWLEEVKDPEIPVLSLVDLGVITEVSIEGERVKVEMTPTFVGYPAMDFMKQEVMEVLRKHGIQDPEVNISFKDAKLEDGHLEAGNGSNQGNDRRLEGCQ